MNALWKNTVLLTIVVSLLSAQFGCKPKETVNPSNFKIAEWEQEIRNPSLTAANFTKLYIQLVTANITNAQVAVLSPLEITVTITNGGKWKLNLDNLWTEASGNPDGRPEVCRHHLNAIAGFVSGRSGGMAETNSVVPTIKDDVFLSQIPAGLADAGIVSEPYVADLHIVYATDREGIIAFLKKDDQKRFDLDFPTLRNLAVTNLKRIMAPVQERKIGPIFVVGTDDSYSSSLLLLDDFWDARTNLVQGEIVAVAPSRDFIFYTGSESAAGIQQLQQMAEEVYNKKDHIISKTFLARHNGQWQKFAN